MKDRERASEKQNERNGMKQKKKKNGKMESVRENDKWMCNVCVDGRYGGCGICNQK